MRTTETNNNIKVKKEIYMPPILADFKDINGIDYLCRSIWGDGGIYSKKFYISAIKQKLSYVYKDENEKVIGVCLASYNSKTGYVGIDILCVDQNYQGKGLGKALLKTCLENCENRKYYNFILHVATTNKKAIHLYKSNGFELTDFIKNYYSCDPPPDNDAYEMKRKKVREIKSENKEETKNKEENNRTPTYYNKSNNYHEEYKNNSNNTNNKINNYGYKRGNYISNEFDFYNQNYGYNYYGNDYLTGYNYICHW
jgi:ribosomal protein S18 acetylase RimI-like enzyme